MPSPQTLTESDRRLVASWAAECARRVLPIFEDEAPEDARARDAIERALAFSRGDLGAAGEIARRFEAGRAAKSVSSADAIAAAHAAAQAAAVAHMGAHALGAAAYATKARHLADGSDEVPWQLDAMSPDVREALRQLPLLGTDSAGPLGRGLLASGILGESIVRLQAGL